ncbi:unnamed protein product [Peniophora sp. CBMAI 1063]|nr:unnamed protein product [Peniophora sp. CBMAI 1063]
MPATRRLKQTARKSTGGKAPRLQLAMMCASGPAYADQIFARAPRERDRVIKLKSNDDKEYLDRMRDLRAATELVMSVLALRSAGDRAVS